MRKAWELLKAYWWVPLFFLATILAWVIFRRRGTPLAQTRAELAALEAGRRARELEARLGTQEARIQVLVEHQEALAALDEQQAAKAKELGDDPEKLAKFLVRAGSRR